MPVKIALVADVSKLLSGLNSVADEFDDVSASLDEMARDAQRAGRATGDSIERGADDATDAVKKLDRSFGDLTKEVSRSSKSIGDDLSDATDRGTHQAGESVREFKDEARANFSEVASSFSGGIDSAADLVQGTLGGLAGSLAGPAGLAAGVLAGIGGAWLASTKETTEKQRQLIEDLATDMIESGQRVASEGFITQALQDIYTGADGAAVKIADLEKAVALTEVSSGTLARAYVGDADAINTATESIAAKIEDAWDRAHNGPIQERSYWATVATQMQEVQDDINNVSTATDTAAARQEAYNSAVRAGGDAAEGSAARAGNAYDSLGRKLADLPSSKTVTLTLDTADAQRQLDRWKPVVVGQFRNGVAVV